VSLWSTITGTTPQADQQAQLDAKKVAYDAALQRRIDEGTITNDQVSAARDYENGLTLEDTEAGAAEGFTEGLAEGWQNVLTAPGRAVGAVGGSAGTVLWGILKNIPWWAYLIGVIAAFFYLGGSLAMLRRLVRR